MRASCTRHRRWATALVAVGALTACGGSDEPAAAPPPQLPAATTAPSASAGTPEPTAERTPESLAGQVQFTAPPLTDPLQAEAVAAYEGFLREFTVATGLPDGAYPPLVAAIDPSFATEALQQVSGLNAASNFALGPYVETVTEVAGGPQDVLIGTCGDQRQRSFYSSDGTRVTGVANRVVPAIATMTNDGSGWVLGNYFESEDVTCA